MTEKGGEEAPFLCEFFFAVLNFESNSHRTLNKMVKHSTIARKP